MFPRKRRLALYLVSVFALAQFVTACSASWQPMRDQPKYVQDKPSTLFYDGTSTRPLIPDTVARGYLRSDTLLFTGKDASGKDSTVFPFPVTRDVLERGQSRFDIYCAPCHGRLGTGGGVVVARGFTTPPTFHSDRLRNAPVGHFFDVISHGFGAMPDYASQVAPRDRWAIIAYIRALQLSQHATINDVPPAERAKLTSGG